MTFASDDTRSAILPAVGVLGLMSVMAQLALMRELLSAFYGNEMVLGIILGNWLLLTGLGAWLGRNADKLRQPINRLIIGELAIAVLPLMQVFLWRALRNTLFVRGAAIGVTETIFVSFILLAPFCLVAGYMLTLAGTILAKQQGPAGVGQVYIADSLGSIAGGLGFSFILIVRIDHLNLLCWPALVSLITAAWISWRWKRKLLLGVSIIGVQGILVVGLWVDLDGYSAALQYSKQHLVYRGNSPYGKLIVTESAGQYDFFENGLPIISAHNVEKLEETVHYAMAQRPNAAQVLLISGGLSGTAKEILRYNVRQVVYVELDPLILEVGKQFLPGNLAEPRLKVINADGRLFIQQTKEKFDLIIMDVPDPSTSQINRFFTREFFEEARKKLTPNGVFAFALGHYENYLSRELIQLLAPAYQTVKASFANVLAIPGSRIFFLASNGPLYENIVERLQANRISTRLIRRSYYEGIMSADRRADLQRAFQIPAPLNQDFRPVLYYYHLLYWISQFKFKFGLVAGGLLIPLAIYLVVLRPVPLALFASGFAASTLELVLLLGYQILCGSLYYQMGMIITIFMAGLAAGACSANRLLPKAGRRELAFAAFGISALALLIPLSFEALCRLKQTLPSNLLFQAGIGLLTFLVALLVGLAFPLANRVEFNGGAALIARVYTADFWGACLGALLASTLLIPLLGVIQTCLLTALLTAVSGLAVLKQSRAQLNV